MHGQEILDTLRTLNARRIVALIIRHAERFPIVDAADPTRAELNPAGRAAAEYLGARLEGFSRLRLFHSPVTRCQQTAECIARGAESAGLAVTLAGPQDPLGIDYILDLAEAGRLTALHGDHFVRLWFSGKIPANVIRPAAEIAAEKLAYLTARLDEDAGLSRLDLHISHDWNTIILRELMLGVRHEEAGWLDYLDGVAFEPKPGALRAVYRDRAVTHSLPWRFDPVL
ncbi:MAG TPA: histidine phosphatase family protein [Opitutaceae bacterium]|nr:histidine phosphatase family protein [Opitutaceae bacterium]